MFVKNVKVLAFLFLYLIFTAMADATRYCASTRSGHPDGMRTCIFWPSGLCPIALCPLGFCGRVSRLPGFLV